MRVFYILQQMEYSIMHLQSINRLQAFAGHLIASICIAALLALVVFSVWYPGALAYASGVVDIFLLLLFVDVVLGPTFTLIVFNPQKKELKRDLMIIVAIQLIALLYGMHTMFVTRPAYLVFNAKGFDLVYANEISPKNLANAEHSKYKSLPYFGPEVIGAILPNDPVIAKEIMTSAAFGGEDVQNMPRYYTPYENLKQSVQRNILPLKELQELNQDRTQEIQMLVDKYSTIDGNVGYLPVTAKAHNVIAILNRKTAEILEISDLRPAGR